MRKLLLFKLKINLNIRIKIVIFENIYKLLKRLYNMLNKL